MRAPADRAATGRGSTALWAVDRWPGPVQRFALAGGVAGSFLGLAFGVMSINRPLLNGLLFYVLGFVLGALLGAAAAALANLLRGPGTRHSTRRAAGLPVTQGRPAPSATIRHEDEE